MSTKALSFLSAAALLVWGCDQGGSASQAETPTATAAQPSTHAKTPPCEHGDETEGCDCSEEGTAVTADNVQTITNQEGKTIQLGGQELGNAEPIAIADLAAKADELKGKLVRVEGNVAAMCHHKRSWFTLVGDDQSGSYVRVLTAPAFLVPPGSIGKTARAEGTIDVVEINPATAKHFAERHKLAMPDDGAASAKQVVLRAVGAEFN